MLDERIVFLCSKEQKKEWLEVAKSNGISLGEFIRAAIELYGEFARLNEVP